MYAANFVGGSFEVRKKILTLRLKETVLSAMFLAIGIILPVFMLQIKEIGDSLLPMHIPVLLCGFICGPLYGMSVGALLPVVKALLFSVPPLYPNSIWMALELAAYGFIAGLLYSRKKSCKIGYLYFCLVSAMLGGRIAWGLSKAMLLGLGGKPFTFYAFLAGGFIDALPGIIIQLILIPTIVKAVAKHSEKS